MFGSQCWKGQEPIFKLEGQSHVCGTDLCSLLCVLTRLALCLSATCLSFYCILFANPSLNLMRPTAVGALETFNTAKGWSPNRKVKGRDMVLISEPQCGWYTVERGLANWMTSLLLLKVSKRVNHAMGSPGKPTGREN